MIIINKHETELVVHFYVMVLVSCYVATFIRLGKTAVR